MTGGMGSYRAGIWEGPYIPWGGCSNNGPECELWDVSSNSDFFVTMSEHFGFSVCLAWLVIDFCLDLKPLPKKAGPEDTATACGAWSQGSWH